MEREYVSSTNQARMEGERKQPFSKFVDVSTFC
jgi:hypothetical protein